MNHHITSQTEINETLEIFIIYVLSCPKLNCPNISGIFPSTSIINSESGANIHANPGPLIHYCNEVVYESTQNTILSCLNICDILKREI